MVVIKIKVALLCSAYGISRHYHGGPAIMAFHVHKALDTVGIDNEVYYTIPDVDPYYTDDRCHHIPGGIQIGGGEEIKKDVKYVIKEDDYDIYYVLNSDRLALDCNEAGIEPILGSNLIPNSPPNSCLKYLSQAELEMRRSQIVQERNLIKGLKYSRWLYQSKFQLGEYQRLGMLDISKTRQGNNGIDTELFTPFDNYDDVIIWSGRRWWPKGYWILEKIAKSLPNEAFRIFSNDVLGIRGANFKIITGLSHYQIAERLNGKILLCTSTTENQPLAILESQSCGLPIVASNVSGIPEIVDDKGGIICDVDKPREFVEAIDTLNQDEELRKQMGKYNRRYIEKNFALEVMGNSLKDIYKEVII